MKLLPTVVIILLLMLTNLSTVQAKASEEEKNCFWIPVVRDESVSIYEQFRLWHILLTGKTWRVLKIHRGSGVFNASGDNNPPFILIENNHDRVILGYTNDFLVEGDQIKIFIPKNLYQQSRRGFLPYYTFTSDYWEIVIAK